MSVPEAEFLERVGTLVRLRTGIDLHCYRPTALARRIENRMISVGAASTAAYLELLRANDDEVHRLLERVTIKVSWLYRNPAVFEQLRTTVLPRLRNRAQPLRIWSAGCARGEEAFSVAMLLEEAGLGGEILATDIDARALEHGRRARLDREAVRYVPRPTRDRFIADPGLELDARIRDRVRFEHHDLTRCLPDAWHGRFDLVLCRNLLIYLQRDVQDAVLQRLVAALAGGGFLVLGEAEWPSLAAVSSLEVIHRTARIFRLKGTGGRTLARP